MSNLFKKDEMSKEERPIERYILGQDNEYGMIEWLVDDVVRDWCILEFFASTQMGSAGNIG